MASGKLIDINNFTVDDVNLDDIAHNLSKIQRFNGAIPIGISYSVAEHCINLSNYFNNKLFNVSLGLHALLHDASEALLSDILSPIKVSLIDYKILEEEIQAVIYRRFGLQFPFDNEQILSTCDKRILIDEVETIMPDKLEIYKHETGLEKLGCHIMFNNHPSTVKRCFLKMCEKMGIIR